MRWLAAACAAIVLSGCGDRADPTAAVIPYYPETNPSFVEMAVRTVEAVLADLAR